MSRVWIISTPWRPSRHVLTFPNGFVNYCSYRSPYGEFVHIGVGLYCCSFIRTWQFSRPRGVKRTTCGSRFFCVFTAIDWQRLEADMNMLLNTYIKRGCYSPPHIGLTSIVFSKAKYIDTLVFFGYAQQEGHEGFGSSCHLRRGKCFCNSVTTRLMKCYNLYTFSIFENNKIDIWNN